MPDSLKASKTPSHFQELIAAAESQKKDGGLPPVEKWHPEREGEIDIVIKRDGSWWHEGDPIRREALAKLFSTILRKDADGETYLVTPAEKLRIEVEGAPFQAVRMDVEGEGKGARIFFTTNMDDVIELGPDRPLRVETDDKTLEPSPYIHVRGRLEALLTRSVFYELAELAVEKTTPDGPQLGVYAGGEFYPLGPAGAHRTPD